MASYLARAAQTLTRGPLQEICVHPVHTAVTNVGIVTGTLIGGYTEAFGMFHSKEPSVQLKEAALGAVGGAMYGFMYGFWSPIVVPCKLFFCNSCH